MKYLFLFLTSINLPCSAFSQSQNPFCNCPVSVYADTKADTIFHLSNNYTIALCGYRDTGIIKNKVLYSEFVLSECYSNKIIKFWDAVTICNLRVVKDTLLVETLVDFPVDKAMGYKETIWTIEHIYFVNGSIARDSVINPQLPKYNSSQISGVLKLYSNTPNANDDKTSELMDKLFICTISGSERARYYLVNFEKKFTNVDGANAEQYDTIMRMLKLWDKK